MTWLRRTVIVVAFAIFGSMPLTFLIEVFGDRPYPSVLPVEIALVVGIIVAWLDSRSGSVATSHAVTKECPRCAETVKAAAVVCRFCRHEFAVAVAMPAPVANQPALPASPMRRTPSPLWDPEAWRRAHPRSANLDGSPSAPAPPQGVG